MADWMRELAVEKRKKFISEGYCQEVNFWCGMGIHKYRGSNIPWPGRIGDTSFVGVCLKCGKINIDC